MMSVNENPKTIHAEIERLARRTGAPSSFVVQVRTFFESKRIALTTDAEPYLPALEECFQLEESVRRNTRRARESLLRLQECLRLVGATYQHQLGQLRRVRESLDHQGRAVRESARRLVDLTKSAPKQRGAARAPGAPFLVPGPTDLQ